MWISNCRQFRNNISPRRVVSTRRLRREHAATRICLLQILWVLNQLQSFQICDGLLVDPTALDGITSLNSNSDNGSINSGTVISSSSSIGGGGGRLWDKFDNMERSVGAVLIKVAYGTTSTTKRSIPDNSYVPSLTTVATPPLTTLRYLEKTQNHQQINLHHRNYELDLERDHALPTSAPNADILKSNSNPTYPNPNRHRNHDRDRHRHVLNSTPAPSIHNLLKKGPPTIPMFSGDMPSYSPPLRSFFTPPLPPEYQNPFADKPTLRGTSNDAGVVNTGTYINRRPIPPPSLMPGQERIPLRPPDLNTSNGNSSPISPSGSGGGGGNQHSFAENGNPRGSGLTGGINTSSSSKVEDGQRKKALNTPSQKSNNKMDPGTSYDKNVGQQQPSSSSHPGGGSGSGIITGNIGSNGVNSATTTNNETSSNTGRLHLPSISRILSSSNGRKEDIPEVLLRTVTARPTHHPPSSPVKQSPNDGKNPNINKNKNNNDDGGGGGSGLTGNIDGNKNQLNGANNNNDNQNTDDGIISSEEDDFDMFVDSNNDQEEPKTQPKIKMSTKSTETPANDENSIYSTQIIHNLANINNEKSLLTTSTPGGGHHSGAGGGGGGNGGTGGSIGGSGASSGTNSKDSSGDSSAKHGVATWTVAWNIHVYLSAILFTILAVYSIFKMIFYDKLTHLFNQSYFICIHLILIIICMSRIFYLCYDAYNIHSSFHLFVSEILLNLPATFLTISFSVLILFLLIRSLNHKNNRYSALIRPLTVVVGSSVHVGLCITLHYVESYTANHSHQAHYYQQQQQLYRNAGGYRGGASTVSGGGGGVGGGGVGGSGSGTGYNNHQMPPPPPPRVLSLICQIIYIFVCLSLGLLYLYIYRILKRVLRSKSQNYIHGYQNLSYAIHITIATALLYVLLAALQIYGAISISTTRPLITSSSEIDWLQWGYQFSLRLIEIAIITLMSWVAGLKTGGNSGVLQREKAADTHNVSGFALFPCTSSSSQEHFETDYPAVCNANTNLHTYTLRTGKPIYDDNFALNSLAGGGGGNTGGGAGSGATSGQQVNPNNQQQRLTPLNNEFQIQNSNDFVRSYETSSLRSAGGGGGNNNNHHHHHHHHHHHQTSAPSSQIMDGHQDFITDPQTDHYENPNFELRSTKQDNCYSEPLNSHGHHMVAGGGGGGGIGPNVGGYDFQNFERPVFGSGGAGGMMNGINGGCERPSSRGELQHSSKLNNKSMKSMTSNHLDRSNYENPERRSSNSTHSCTSGRHHPSYNSFERRSGVRKSGTLSNIGGIVHGRNGSSSSSSSSSRPSGVQTLSSAHNRNPPGLCNAQNTATGRMVCVASSGGVGGGGVGVGGIGGPVGGGNATCTTGKPFYRDRNHRSSLERSSSAAMQQYIMPSDDEIPERANLIKSAVNGSGSAITSSTSGNLTDGCMQQLQHQQQPQHTHQVASSSSGDSATSGSMLVAEHGFVRFRALDDMNNAQGVGIHNASIRTNGRNKEKRFTNNT